MGVSRGNITTRIVKDGLIFNMDPANRASYPRTGTTVTDTIGNITATLTGTGGSNNTPQWENTNSGIFDLDGTDDYINSNPSTSGLTNISISCWTKFENINNSDFQYVVHLYNTVQSNSWRIGVAMIKSNYSTSSDRFKLYTIDGPSLNISSFVVSQDVWYNVVVTQSGTIRKLYVDGVLISTFTVPVLNLGNIFDIGRFQNDNHYLPGKISLTNIYNRALSAEEVLRNYNGLRGRFGL